MSKNQYMGFRRLIALSSLFVVVLVVYLLMTASEVLMVPVLEEPFLPAGTLITWLGYIALPLSVYFGFQSLRAPRGGVDRVFAIIFKVLIFAGLIWGGVAFSLAGNRNFSFGNTEGFRGSVAAGRIYWQFCYILAGLPILGALVYGLIRFLRQAILG